MSSNKHIIAQILEDKDGHFAPLDMNHGTLGALAINRNSKGHYDLFVTQFKLDTASIHKVGTTAHMADAEKVADMYHRAFDSTGELEGMICPKCGRTNEFNIRAEIMVNVSEEGGFHDVCDSMRYDGNSYCTCPGCLHEGIINDFKLETLMGCKEIG